MSLRWDILTFSSFLEGSLRTSLIVSEAVAKDVDSLLDFCLSTTNFKYNNTHYQPIFDTAMGSPVSAVTANLVMENLEQRALSTSLVQPRFWKRYVDDLCAVVKSGLVQTLQDSR